jgi:hypothetical protein
MSETPEQKYSRLQTEIQRAILQSYPNPDRRGCPGDAAVQRLASNPDQITVADEKNENSVWYHVTHCSPCYASFLEVRNAECVEARDRQQITRRVVVAAAITAIAGATGWLVISRGNRFRNVELDLDTNSTFRGENDGGQQQSKLELPNGRLHVTVKLPKGSANGLYSVELRNATTDQSVFAKVVPSSLEQGFQKLRFDLYLHVNPGMYTVGFRNDHRDVWRYYSVSVN